MIRYRKSTESTLDEKCWEDFIYSEMQPFSGVSGTDESTQ